MITYDQWRKEQKAVGDLRRMADRLSGDIIAQRILDQEQLDERIAAAEILCRQALPDKLELFNLVYLSRFQRLWEQFRGRS
jgi:hypothetical protein